MKRVIPLMLLGTLTMIELPVFSAPIGAYSQIMQAVYARDEASLKYLISVGLNINATNMQGKTALCTAVENQDYEGYELLLSQGATTRTPCMRNMNPEILNRFVAEQPPLGTYYKGAVLTASRNGAFTTGKEVATTIASLPYPHLAEILLGGVAVGTAFAVGVHGGGGGGDNPGPGPDPKDYNYESPFQTDDPTADNYLLSSDFSSPTVDTLSRTQKGGISGVTTDLAKKYQTEYEGGLWLDNGNHVVTATNSSSSAISNINFLSVLNAKDAYARGYSGYKIDRDSMGNLLSSGWDAVLDNRDDKVKVAVMDTGLFYHTDLPSYLYQDWVSDPLDTYQQSIGINYEYGVESVHNNSSYWTYDSGSSKAYLHKDGSIVLTLTGLDSDDWIKYQGKFAPKCGSGVDGDGRCLLVTDDSTSYYTVQYVLDTDHSDVKATYYIYENLWNEYVAKYGLTGYVYKYVPSLPTEDPIDNTTNATPNFFEEKQYSDLDHGTHVAGIIGALRDGSGIQGVAYDAEILPVKIDLAMGSALLFSQIPEVAEKAKIINLSLGVPEYLSDGTTRRTITNSPESFVSNDSTANSTHWNSLVNPYQTEYLKTATESKAIQVFSAGNNAQAQPSIHTAAPLVEKDAFENLFLVVAALGDPFEATYHTDTGDIAAYSNRCGATASYCLSAPGGGVSGLPGAYTMTSPIVSTGISTDNIEDAYKAYVGTSMAAPMVSGSLAVLMGAFPFLTTQQAVQILLNSATYIPPTTDEIKAYNKLATGDETNYTIYDANFSDGEYNAIYGHGLVNLDEATKPSGPVKISLSSVATSTNSVLAANSFANVSPVVANALNSLPENLIVLDNYTRAYQMPTRQFFQTEKRSDALRRSFRSFMTQDEKVANVSDSLSFAFNEAPSDKKNLQTGSISMMMRPNTNVQMRLGFSQDTASFGGSYIGRSLQNPFMNMRQAFGTDLSFKLAKNWALTGSWYSGKNGFIDEDIFDKMTHQSRMQLVESGMAYQGIKNVTLGVSGGIMDEEESLFGTRGVGAFNTDGAQTRFVRVMANYQPTDKFRFSGSYTYGMTDANRTDTLMQFSRLTSDSFALAAEYTPDEKQTFGVKMVSPLRIRSGSANFNLPVARDPYEDRIYRETFVADLKPTAREYDLSLFYMNEISPDLLWAGETGMRLNPDHQSGATPDYRALFKLNWKW